MSLYRKFEPCWCLSVSWVLSRYSSFRPEIYRLFGDPKLPVMNWEPCTPRGVCELKSENRVIIMCIIHKISIFQSEYFVFKDHRLSVCWKWKGHFSCNDFDSLHHLNQFISKAKKKWRVHEKKSQQRITTNSLEMGIH